jgi:DNA polymerase-3 subunit beta
MEAGKEKVDIYPSNNNILFDTGSVKIVSRLIQGEYMNYRGILPQTAETTLTISPSALLDAIERASLVITTDDKRYPVRLTIRMKTHWSSVPAQTSVHCEKKSRSA